MIAFVGRLNHARGGEATDEKGEDKEVTVFHKNLYSMMFTSKISIKFGICLV